MKIGIVGAGNIGSARRASFCVYRPRGQYRELARARREWVGKQIGRAERKNDSLAAADIGLVVEDCGAMANTPGGIAKGIFLARHRDSAV